MKIVGSQWKINRTTWWRGGAVLLLLLALSLSVKLALANIYPDYLRNGRTYDQETNYIQRNGSVSYISLFHRDNTSLPAADLAASLA